MKIVSEAVKLDEIISAVQKRGVARQVFEAIQLVAIRERKARTSIRLWR